MSKLFYLQNLPEQLKDQALLLDTNILIEATKTPKLRDLLANIGKAGCPLLTTSSVRSEFLRGAKDYATRQSLEKIFALVGIKVIRGVDSMMFSSAGAFFQLVIHKLAPKASLPDEELLFLATTLIDGNRAINLATINFKDVPTKIYECQHIINIQDDNGIRPIGVYSAKPEALSDELLAVAPKHLAKPLKK